MSSRLFWLVSVGGIVGLGILSRVVPTGFVVWDKWLGDALYAAMVYGILRVFAMKAGMAAVWAMAAMTAIETFQLTMIPAHLLESEHLVTRVCARLIGVQFSFLDLGLYAVGIGIVYGLDRLFDLPG